MSRAASQSTSFRSQVTLPTTAGLTTLRLATDEVYRHIDSAATRLAAEVGDALSAAGVPHLVQSAGNMFTQKERTDAHREYINELLDDLFNRVVNTIAERRP